MFRFNTLNDYDNRIDELTRKIKWHRQNHSNNHVIVEYEMLKLSYIVEKKDFINVTFSKLEN